MDETESWQKNLDEKLKRKLSEIRLTELAELIFAKNDTNLSDEETQGRQSGSLAWRLSRSETSLQTSKQFVIKPTPQEEENMVIDVAFNLAKDQYVRESNAGEVVKGWSSLTFESENLLKKDELDWKMTYLARKGNHFFLFIYF